MSVFAQGSFTTKNKKQKQKTNKPKKPDFNPSLKNISLRSLKFQQEIIEKGLKEYDLSGY
jgi:hypothetical protein